MDKEHLNISFIGAGNIALAIANGLIKNGFSTKNIKAYDISETSASHFNQLTGIEAILDPKKVIEGSDVIIVAVKPQYANDAFNATAKYLGSQLLISVVTGINIENLQTLSNCKRIVRSMPNIPALIGEGITAYTPSDYVTKADLKITEEILASTGHYLQVLEEQIDAVTAVSGSGPAYTFSFIQALIDAGVRAGLQYDISKKIAAQTVLGAAKMVMETNEHPASLCNKVTSPGGVTAEGLAVFEERAFKGVILSAVDAGFKRSVELGKI